MTGNTWNNRKCLEDPRENGEYLEDPGKNEKF